MVGASGLIWGGKAAMRKILLIVIATVSACALLKGGVSRADEAKAPQVQPAQTSEAAKETASPSEEWRNRWYFFWGPANVHAELRESQSEINRQLNDIYGRIIPGWDRPRTFLNLSNEWLLYDLHLGVGRDINEKLSVFVDVGGIIGKVNNDDTYHIIGIPLHTRINFGRTVWFIAAGLDYYPWGKPCLRKYAQTQMCGLLRALRAARPFLEGAIGHVHVRETADVSFSIPDVIQIAKRREVLYHDVNYISPRVGLEIPVGKDDSVVLAAGYLFFDSHAKDFNNLSLYVLHHHKF